MSVARIALRSSIASARAAGLEVRAIPGPSAAIAALSIAGLPTDRFLFLGFLPAKAKARADAIAEIAGVRATLVIYETGPRLGDTLQALLDILGDQAAVLTRELTKLYEESFIGTLGELAERFRDAAPKGEMVIVVSSPPAPAHAGDDELDAALDRALERLSPSRAAAEVAELLNVPRKRAYARALERSRS
jgi:16S rRNA (cytidine1402-2'-O)-methyltransferase